MDIELKNEKRKEYDYPDPNDRIGKISYGVFLSGIVIILSFIFSFVFLLPLTTLNYDWQAHENDLKHIDPPSNLAQQQLQLSKGFSIESFDDPSGKIGPVVVLKDKKRNVIWSVSPEESKSIRFDSWVYIPFHSIRVKGKMTYDEGPQKNILFLLHTNGKLKTIYGQS